MAQIPLYNWKLDQEIHSAQSARFAKVALVLCKYVYSMLWWDLPFVKD